MKKVIGIATYDVIVECPNCEHKVSAVDYDFDSEVTDAMFKNTLASCTNMGIEIGCPKCNYVFILDELEY